MRITKQCLETFDQEYTPIIDLESRRFKVILLSRRVSFTPRTRAQTPIRLALPKSLGINQKISKKRRQFF